MGVQVPDTAMRGDWNSAHGRETEKTMPVPRKRAPHGGGRRMSRLAGAAVSASVLGALAAVAVTGCASSASPSGPSGASGPSGPAAPASASASASGGLAAGESGLCAATMKLDSLTVQRTDALPGNRTRFSFPATEKVTSPAAAQSVAQNLCGLPQVPRKTVACPADFGVSYQLSFAAGSQRFAPVTVNAGGCQLVHGLGEMRRVTTSAALWRTLGIAIGIPHPDNTTFSGTSSNAAS
jgi:hypothetical protein